MREWRTGPCSAPQKNSPTLNPQLAKVEVTKAFFYEKWSPRSVDSPKMKEMSGLKGSFIQIMLPKYADKFTELLRQSRIECQRLEESIESELHRESEWESEREGTRQTENPFLRMRSIGVGAHSFVYLVQESHTNALYAQKSISLAQANQTDIINETKILLFLSHPNLIQLYHVYAEANYIHLVLEYAEDSLFGLKERFKFFKEKEIVEVLKQLLRGVAYLHSLNIVHADIKLENIMIGNGTIKLVDFGYAHIELQSPHKDTVGTLEYLAPQYVMGVDSGKKRDIWALGILAFELLLGRSPFEGLSEGEKWAKLVAKHDYLQEMHERKETLKIQCGLLDKFVRHTLCEALERWDAQQLLALPMFS